MSAKTWMFRNPSSVRSVFLLVGEAWADFRDHELKDGWQAKDLWTGLCLIVDTVMSYLQGLINNGSMPKAQAREIAAQLICDRVDALMTKVKLPLRLWFVKGLLFKLIKWGVPFLIDHMAKVRKRGRRVITPGVAVA